MKDIIKDFPEKSGVYIMKNEKNRIIYIGKAKNLKKRLQSYFLIKKDRDLKTKELVKHIASIEYIICRNEVEALILENNLIKKHQPKYNILLKDQKTYPYIKVTEEKFPRLSYSRKITDKSKYYGPYPQLNMKYALKTLMKVFQIRDCKINVYANNKRACLKYDLKLCNAPCVYKDQKTVNDYENNAKMLNDFLSGKSREVITKIKSNMDLYSKNLEFEKAIQERERINILNKLLENQYIDQKNNTNEDVFVFKELEEKIYITVINIRDGILINKQNLQSSYTRIEETNILTTLLTKYYDNQFIPKKIILDYNYYLENNFSFEEDKKTLEEWFKIEKGKNVSIISKHLRAKDKNLLSIGLSNLQDSIREDTLKKISIFEGLKKLQTTLHLKSFPKRIDCFDISNTQGNEPVAAMTVSINGILKNNLYRHFNIKSKNTPDDFLMLKEATLRRYSKITEDEIPNLILIDGGKGQLSSVVSVLRDLDILKNTDIISIAKREEEIFKEGESDSYIFSKSDESLKILQRLRDEAHRFGITHHRKRRSKRNLHSSLDDIKGIGPKYKKMLISKFGSFSKIQQADYDDLIEVVPKMVAENIIEYFRGEDE